jgi:AraC-like DNA-binding protein
VKEFYYRETRIDEIAGMLNISTSYFCRKFKQFYGVTFITYLNDIRLREARELLEKTSLSITEISHKVGFTEITYFSRSFKKKFGYAPSHLR